LSVVDFLTTIWAMRPEPIERIRFRYTHSIDDADVAWCLHVFNEREALRWCVGEIRRHYAASRISVISDGDATDYGPLAVEFGLSFVRGEHLRPTATGHLYVERLLKTMVSGPETYLFKIDPDTWIRRRFNKLPLFSCLLGTIESISEVYRQEIAPANLQGGAIGITRDAAEDILASGLLNEANCVINRAQTWARCKDFQVYSKRAVSEDSILTWAADRLGIPVIGHPEIACRFRHAPTGPFAVTHPHKIMQVSD
jgi:hypothetical protein